MLLPVFLLDKFWCIIIYISQLVCMCVLKRANDLNKLNWLILLWRCIRNLKPFCMNRNRPWTCQTHGRDIINIFLISSSWSVHSKLQILVFSPSIYGPSAKRAGQNSKGKKSVCNLQYGSRTRLVRGMYIFCMPYYSSQDWNWNF